MSKSATEEIRNICRANPGKAFGKILHHVRQAGIDSPETYIRKIIGEVSREPKQPKRRGRPPKSERLETLVAGDKGKLVRPGVTSVNLGGTIYDPIVAICGTKKLAAEVGGMRRLREIVDALLEVA